MPKVRQVSPARSELPIVSSSFDPENPLGKVALLKARALEHINEVQGFEITTQEDAQLAAEGVTAIAATKKDIDATRKAFLDPVNAEHDRIHKPFKAAMDLCDRAREVLEAPLIAFRLRLATEQRKAMVEATQAVKVNDTPALTTALQTVAAAAPRKLEGLSVTARWEATVVAPDLLLPEWTMVVPNQLKIAAHAAACPPDREPNPVPGVRFELVCGTRVTGKKA